MKSRSSTPSARRHTFAVAVAVCAALPMLVACGPREPGPHEAERGQIFYWQVTSSEVVAGDKCTDNESFRSDLEPEPLEANTFLMYRLSEDGRTAVAQTCTSTDADSCVDSETGIVFDVSGNELISDPPPAVRDVEGSSCDLEGDELWTVEDQGETMRFTLDVEFNLVGDPLVCADLERQAEADAPNGEGMNGCVVSMLVDGEFYSAQTP